MKKKSRLLLFSVMMLKLALNRPRYLIPYMMITKLDRLSKRRSKCLDQKSSKVPYNRNSKNFKCSGNTASRKNN